MRGEEVRWKWTKCVSLKLLPFRLIYSHGWSCGKEFNKSTRAVVHFLLSHFIVQIRNGAIIMELAGCKAVVETQNSTYSVSIDSSLFCSLESNLES